LNRFGQRLYRTVERRRVELPTSSLRTNESLDGTAIKQDDSESRPESSHDCSETNATFSLARLLAELAALPPEQRAAVTALLNSAAPQTPVPTTEPVPTAPARRRLFRSSNGTYRNYSGR
jgi:hypothetical protein